MKTPLITFRNGTWRVRTSVTIDFGERRYFTLKMFQHDESGKNGMLIGWYPYHWLYGLTDVVRLNIYTTDVEGFAANRSLFLDGLLWKGCREASTHIGMARLARPEFLIEIEAIAGKRRW